MDAFSFPALLWVLPFVMRVLRVTGILDHCKISIFILVYPLSSAQLILPSETKQWLLPSFPSLAKQRFESSLVVQRVVRWGSAEALLWPALTLPSRSARRSGSSVLLVCRPSEIRPLRYISGPACWHLCSQTLTWPGRLMSAKSAFSFGLSVWLKACWRLSLPPLLGILCVTGTWYILLQPFKMLLLSAVHSSAGRL